MVFQNGNVSTRHAQITFRGGMFIVVDLGSTNGIYVNGRMADKPIVINGPNTVHIAVFALSISMIREAA
ncbi:MAG: FHA domain-containing protein [Myxococcales bacterium]|nr:FHA domain-containing protein [Myxococcales bacterium]